MHALDDLLSVGLWAFALAHLLAQFAAKEIGHAFGQRQRHAEEPKEASEAAGFVTAGLIGLLGFALALTLSFAQTRFEERRGAALAEANAIGTAWLRAQAIGHPAGSEIARELEAYLALRRDFVTAPADRVLLDRIYAETSAAQTRMWSHLSTITAARTDPVAASLMAALNETFDAATTLRFAYEARLPRELVTLLLALSLVAIGTIGYQFGVRGPPRRLLSTLLLATWTAALTLVADLSVPRKGDIRVSAAAYEWTAQGMGAPLR
jgi:hypothetical protein